MLIAQKWQTAKLFMLTIHQNLHRFCIFALQIICSEPMYNILRKFCFWYVLHVCTFRIFAFCPSHLTYFHLHTFQTTTALAWSWPGWNTKISIKIRQKLRDGTRSPNFETKAGAKAPIVRWQNFRQKPFGGADIGQSTKPRKLWEVKF